MMSWQGMANEHLITTFHDIEAELDLCEGLLV